MTIEPLGGIGAIVKTAGALPGVVWGTGLVRLCGCDYRRVVADPPTPGVGRCLLGGTVAATEQAIIRSLVGWQQMEQSRAAFVRDAEVISREHSLWPSSRRIRAGVPE